MLQFVGKSRNQLKCCIGIKRYESIKMLTLECKGSNQWKCWAQCAKCQMGQILQFEWKSRNQSKCWNLSEKVEIDENSPAGQGFWHPDPVISCPDPEQTQKK